MAVVTVKNALLYNSCSGCIITIKPSTPNFSIKEFFSIKADISVSRD